MLRQQRREHRPANIQRQLVIHSLAPHRSPEAMSEAMQGAAVGPSVRVVIAS